MNFEFKCPDCGRIINEKDFNEEGKILSHWKEIFDNKKKDFTIQLKQEIIKEYKQQYEKEQIQALKIQEQELNQQKNNELHKLMNEINNLNNKIKNYNESKENEIKFINEQLKNKYEKEINTKSNEINHIKNEKDKYINELLLTIKEKDSKINSNEIIMQNKILEITNNFNETKNKEISALTESKNKEIEILKEENKELNIKNMQFRSVQNKFKGEEFEHEVDYELRKVFEPDDIINKITTEGEKADFLHQIRKDDRVIGKIVYEVKNAEWKDSWEKKLANDMSKEKSKYGVLIATSFNKKYPNIPFKRSDYNHNIYLSDPQSYTFIAQILKSLIKVEHRLEQNYSQQDYETKIKKFNDWKNTILKNFTNLIEEQCNRIQFNENSILKKVDEIRIAREKILNNWIKNIKTFLESLDF